MEKFELWRSGMKDKGLRVNMDKTKILLWNRAKPVHRVGSQVASGRVVHVVKGLAESQFFALSVGSEIHKRCSGVKGSLEKLQEFQNVENV